MASYIEYLPNDAPYQFQDRVRKASFNETQFHLVNDISRRYAELNTAFASLKRQYEEDALVSSQAPTNKKRKLEGPANTANGNGTMPAASSNGSIGEPSFKADNISFVTPQRKKFSLGLVPDSSSGSGGLITDGTVLIRWKHIEQVICVSVPEKATPAHYFVIIPAAEAAKEGSLAEPIVFTVPDSKVQDVTFTSGEETYVDLLFHDMFTKLIDIELRKVNKKISTPDAREFQSAIVQGHRKGEKAHHVRAFKGSKDGFLYFLSTGILFGFKKPVLFFPLHSITSTSYSSVLQRTFNLNITAQLSASDSTFCIPGAPTSIPEPAKEVEFEFSMLDQVDYAGIDAYVKGHGLNDASLAEGRRAKRFNVNPVKGINPGISGAGAVDVESEEDEEESELQRAERKLQDAEDELEEDYEESGGESDGSGSESGSEHEEEENGIAYDEGDEEIQEDIDQEENL